MPIEHSSGKIEKPESPAAVATNFERKLDRVRVLIAEDDFLIALQIQEALLAAGLQVVGTATTADEVLDLASQGTSCLYHGCSPGWQECRGGISARPLKPFRAKQLCPETISPDPSSMNIRSFLTRED
jgi:hypothetical protein